MVFIVLGGIVLLKCLMGETEVLLTFFSLSRVNMQQAEKKSQTATDRSEGSAIKKIFIGRKTRQRLRLSAVFYSILPDNLVRLRCQCYGFSFASYLNFRWKAGTQTAAGSLAFNPSSGEREQRLTFKWDPLNLRPRGDWKWSHYAANGKQSVHHWSFLVGLCLRASLFTWRRIHSFNHKWFDCIGSILCIPRRTLGRTATASPSKLGVYTVFLAGCPKLPIHGKKNDVSHWKFSTQISVPLNV